MDTSHGAPKRDRKRGVKTEKTFRSGKGSRYRELVDEGRSAGSEDANPPGEPLADQKRIDHLVTEGKKKKGR